MEKSLFKKVSRRGNYTLYEQLPDKYNFFCCRFYQEIHENVLVRVSQNNKTDMFEKKYLRDCGCNEFETWIKK